MRLAGGVDAPIVKAAEQGRLPLEHGVGKWKPFRCPMTRRVPYGRGALAGRRHILFVPGVVCSRRNKLGPAACNTVSQRHWPQRYAGRHLRRKKGETIVRINLLRRALLALALIALGFGGALAQTPDPLPSWNDGAAKKTITDFVARVTTAGSPDFVPANERIAAFDNDGTLWTEQPLYTQAVFTYEHMQALAAQHPEWKRPRAVQIAGRARHDGAGKTRTGDVSGRRRGVGRLRDRRELCSDGDGLDRDCASQAVQSPLHGARLSADAGAIGAYACERLQDVCRIGRQYRVHAAVDGESLRHPARAGDRLLRRREVPDRSRRQANDRQAFGD